MSGPSFGAAARILAERDPVIARLVAEAGLPRLGRPTETHLGTLVRAIVYQQLAGRAAAAIHGRLIAAADGDVQPEPLLALTDEQMRAVGLSLNKMASLRDLAAKVLDGTVVLSPRGLARGSVYEIISRPTARELKPLGEPFRPYRSVAAWYCWRAAELYAGAAASAMTRLNRVCAPGPGHDGEMQNSPWRRPPASYSNGPGAAAAAEPQPPSSAATRRCSVRPPRRHRRVYTA